LETYAGAHPRLRAIVIDTWALVAPHPKGVSRPQYEGDYAALTPLKRLAEAHHLALVLVHHLRKAGASDVIDEITGSTGLAGAADAILVLKRERGQEQGSLFVTGRDIPQERFLPLRFDMATVRWRPIRLSRPICAADSVGNICSRRSSYRFAMLSSDYAPCLRRAGRGQPGCRSLRWLV